MTSRRSCIHGARCTINLLALTLLAPGCVSYSSTPDANKGSARSGGAASGGQSGTSTAISSGGNGSAVGGQTGTCSNEASCGGNVVGTWNVASSCLTLSGKLNLADFLGANCPAMDVTGTLQVTGSWSAKADGTYQDNTTTTGSEQFSLSPACMSYSGTTLTCSQVSVLLQAAGYASVDCANAPGGGCNCSVTIQQSGAPGRVTRDASPSGNFTAASSALTLDGTQSYGFCVSGSKMTFTPQTLSPTTTGSIVFQNSSSSGTGGQTGSGGASGSGGSSALGSTGGVATGTGGATNAGGSSGAGGTNATGGISAAGGVTATGGASTGLGGATGTGGKTGTGGAVGTGGATGTGGSTSSYQGPCDIYGSSGTPCVAAYSTVRLLSSKYSGPLYQIRIGGSNTGTGGTLKDIGTIAGGVFADGPLQDTLCGTSACTISKLYDQSGKGNDLTVAGPGCYVTTADTESSAKGRSLTVSGHKVYALYMVSNSSFGSSTGPIHDGYRNNNATGLPTGTAAQNEYMVVDGKRANAGCCWDFGSARRDSCSTGGTGTMQTVSFGAKFVWDTGAGSGPWFMADFEGGTWTGGSHAGGTPTQNNNDPTVTWDYAFGLVKSDTSNNTPRYALRVGDAQSGALTTAYDGQAPAVWNLQGAVLLGIGGDNSNTSYGTFFEGAITAGRPSDATDLAVLQNAQAAGYGK